MSKETINPARLASLILIIIFASFAIASCEMNVPTYCWDCGEKLKLVSELEPEGYIKSYYQCTEVPSHKYGIGDRPPGVSGTTGE